MNVLTATTGNEAIALIEETPSLAIVLMDIMMPEMDGYQTIEKIRQDRAYRRLPIIALDRQGDEGRPREMPGGRRIGLSRQAGQHRTALVRAADVAASLGANHMNEKVNVLLVDDQPDKLLAYEVILQRPRRKSRQDLVRARGPAIPAEERSRRRSHRRLHAGARRLSTGRDAPRPSAVPGNSDHFHFRDPSDRRRSAARL